jgi:hypothetical protein
MSKRSAQHATFTIEQDVFLDGFDNVASREKGTRDLLDNLDAFLSNSTVRS